MPLPDDRPPGPAPEAPPLHALLVGIERYPGSDLYPDLEGCIRDVQAMERYLVGVLAVPPGRIEVLAAAGEVDPAQDDTLPSYANLSAALRRLEARCRPGEHALFHYAGHGGRTPTAFPEAKGRAGKDECLVPVDIADPATPYLRDVELDVWVRRMVEKGVFVTLVLDCCHSGGMRRIGEPRVRGGRRIDPQHRPPGELLASPGEQARRLLGRPPAAWNGEPRRVLRHAGIDVTTRARSEGFALFAACRPWEKAREVAFDGIRPAGALTYFLLRALARLGPEASYQQLHAAVVEGVHSRLRGQTPVFEGEVRALPLGHRALPRLRGVEVLDVLPASEPAEPMRLVLGVGHCQGVGTGARFEIVPLAAARAGDEEATPTGSAEVEDAGVSACRAVVRRMPGTGIRAGDRAVLIDPGERTAPRRVRLPAPADPAQEELVGELARRLERRASPWLCPADETADFDLRLGAPGEAAGLSIHDLAGAPLPHLPRLAVGKPGSADRLWRVLEHLARYEELRTLRCEGSALEGKVDVRFEPDPEGTELPAEALAAYPLELETGCRLRLVVENRSYLPLHLVLFDLQPDWGVSQIFPGVPGSSQTDAGGSQVIRLETLLPPGLDQGTDVLKLFAATVPLNGQGMELRPLSGWVESEIRYRSVAPAGHRATDAWLTVQRELRVVRRAE